jgi:hypothetical protein
VKFLCPNCKEPFDLTDEEFPRYAGKKARCPSCRAVMEIPETPPVQTAVAVVPAITPCPAPTAPPIIVRVPAPQPTPRGKSVWKVLMLITTITWIVVIPVLTFVLFDLTSSRAKVIYEGQYVLDENNDVIPRDRWIASAMVSSAISGLCCSTVPYMIAMTVLIVIHVATRD